MGLLDQTKILEGLHQIYPIDPLPAKIRIQLGAVTIEGTSLHQWTGLTTCSSNEQTIEEVFPTVWHRVDLMDHRDTATAPLMHGRVETCQMADTKARHSRHLTIEHSDQTFHSKVHRLLPRLTLPKLV